MPFLQANIDRAIVITQFYLQGFYNPLEIRFEKGEDNKGFSFIPCNLIACADGCDYRNGKFADGTYVNSMGASFKDCLKVCKELAFGCDGVQIEAIQLIIQEILQQAEKRKAKVASGESEPSSYLKSLKKNNWWGRIVIALAEAFEVSLEKATV